MECDSHGPGFLPWFPQGLGARSCESFICPSMSCVVGKSWGLLFQIIITIPITDEEPVAQRDEVAWTNALSRPRGLSSLCPRLYHRSTNDPSCVYSRVQLHSTLTFVISCVLNSNCEMDRAEAQMPMFSEWWSWGSERPSNHPKLWSVERTAALLTSER